MRRFVPPILAALALLAGSTQAATPATPAPLQHVHGKVVAVDPQHGTFQLHHDPFPAMPMAMTMVVRAKRAADLKRLKPGETIDATVDVNRDPWVATSIVVR